MTPFSLVSPCALFVSSVVNKNFNHQAHLRYTKESPVSLASLLRPSGERQQGDVARLLDGSRQTPLVRRAHAG